MPVVSVVIPAYNAEATLARAIDSVLAQAHQDLEVLVCDDGSTDRTPAILEGYAGRVVTIAQPNRGRGAARNACLARATGAFIALLDADDWWTPGKLATQLDAAATRADCDVFYANAYVVNAGGTIYRTMNGDCHVGHSGWVFPFLVRHNFVPTSTVLVRRAAAARAGSFDDTLPRCQDLEWLLRLATTSRFHYVNAPLAFYDDHSFGTNEKHTATYENYLRVLEKTEQRQPELARRYHAFFAKSYSDAHYALASHHESKGDFERAAMDYAAALRHTPEAPAVRWHHALALYRSGDYPATLDALARCLERDPYHAEAHFYAGNAWLGLGDTARAREAFERALYAGYRYQKFPECLNNLGVALARGGEVEQARQLWRQALQQQAFYSDAIRNLQAGDGAGEPLWTVRRVF